MDTPTLVGTGFVVLGGRRLDRLRRLRLPERPEVRPQCLAVGIICLIFGPLGLMVLYVLPKHEPAPRAAAHPAHKKTASRTPCTRSPRRSTRPR